MADDDSPLIFAPKTNHSTNCGTPANVNVRVPFTVQAARIIAPTQAKASHNKRNVAILVIVMLLIGIVAAASSKMLLETQTQTTNTGAISTQSATVNKWTMEKPCNYLVFTDGTTTYAQNCGTGSTDYSGTTSQTVINSAISRTTSGGIIHIKPGTYPLTDQIIDSVNGIIIEGEGNSTILQEKIALSKDAISISGNNSIIRNFELNINGTQGSGNVYYGIVTTGYNETISGTSVLKGDTCGINARGSKNTITNNYVSGMANDNICIWSTSGFVTDTVVSGNVVYNRPSSYITCYALEYVRNVTMTGNTGDGCGIGIAVENLGRGTSKYISIVNNTLVNINGRTNAYAIDIYPRNNGADSGQNITIKGNKFSGTKNVGINIESGSYITITNNSITHTGNDGINVCATCSEITISGNSISSVPAQHQGIYVYSGATDFGIIGNAIDGGGVGHAGVIISGNRNFTVAENTVVGMVSNGIEVDSPSSDFAIIGNTVRSTASGFDAIDVTGSSHFRIEGNVLSGSGVIGTNQWDAGIRISGTSSAGIVSSNTILGDAYGGIYLRNDVSQMIITGNTILKATTGILEDGSPTPDYNTIATNYFVGCTTALTLIGTHDTVKDNSIS